MQNNFKNFNKDLRNIIQNKNENNLKKSQKNFRNKSYKNLIILTNPKNIYNITEKYYDKKNKIYDFQPLIQFHVCILHLTIFFHF